MPVAICVMMVRFAAVVVIVIEVVGGCLFVGLFVCLFVGGWVCLLMLGVALFKYFIKTRIITSTPSKPRATPSAKFH